MVVCRCLLAYIINLNATKHALSKDKESMCLFIQGAYVLYKNCIAINQSKMPNRSN